MKGECAVDRIEARTQVLELRLILSDFNLRVERIMDQLGIDGSELLYRLGMVTEDILSVTDQAVEVRT